jgi:hypothetical protein
MFVKRNKISIMEGQQPLTEERRRKRERVIKLVTRDPQK